MDHLSISEHLFFLCQNLVRIGIFTFPFDLKDRLNHPYFLAVYNDPCYSGTCYHQSFFFKPTFYPSSLEDHRRIFRIGPLVHTYRNMVLVVLRDDLWGLVCFSWDIGPLVSILQLILLLFIKQRYQKYWYVDYQYREDSSSYSKHLLILILFWRK